MGGVVRQATWREFLGSFHRLELVYWLGVVVLTLAAAWALATDMGGALDGAAQDVAGPIGYYVVVLALLLHALWAAIAYLLLIRAWMSKYSREIMQIRDEVAEPAAAGRRVSKLRTEILLQVYEVRPASQNHAEWLDRKYGTVGFATRLAEVVEAIDDWNRSKHQLQEIERTGRDDAASDVRRQSAVLECREQRDWVCDELSRVLFDRRLRASAKRVYRRMWWRSVLSICAVLLVVAVWYKLAM